MLLLRCIFLWPHGIAHETSLHVIYCSALNLRKFIKCLIFMPLAWKVRLGHLVIRLFVSPFVWFFFCYSVPVKQKVQYFSLIRHVITELGRHLSLTCNDFYDLSAWGGCWFVVYIRRFIYKFLNVCPFD